MNDTYDDTTIVTTEGEKVQYFLNTYFEGYNLTYSFNDSITPDNHSIEQSLELIANQSTKFDMVEGLYVHEFPDNTVSTGILSTEHREEYFY